MPAVHVLVPVKALGLAKSRLAHALEPEARADLVLAMLQDTLSAAHGLDDAQLTVITSDHRVAAVALESGASVLVDPPAVRGVERSDSLNAALRAAAEHARAQSAGVDLVALQADLPAVRSHELAEALEEARATGIMIVADHTGSGTTALLHCSTQDPLRPQFGPGSARRHLGDGARAVEAALPGLRLDVDTVDDLGVAVRLGVGAATAAVLDRIGSTLPFPCPTSRRPPHASSVPDTMER
ncbi:2-phospho-L-lactate guanylyltransferase [Rhodococcus coprophilus]|uniref:Phosphoenolpyruvate guanylyltransferase n=1 Tax=Rhodococcus coprophilus TaxID=38310 RepID=A0A2X4UW93_9NOCA|nr:2-phospho-L-lactate guanylyltransferase [Rhodococcus coprophilus]MBM7460292.1 2-phospho-L-lactate guanylyltransferase [Rhodococcus coprophilus]SQI38952.1 2-phospho-L-lactate guanylyltransferase [Rhodococcus coprophilus]